MWENSAEKADISIVVPVYNVEDYIVEAIESLMAQTLPPREVIIVDDGSTDRTVELVKQICRDDQITLIQQLNQGCGVARNKGALAATSQYLYFFDGDDKLDSEACRRLHEITQTAKRPDIVVFSGFPFMSENYESTLVFSYRRKVSQNNIDGITAMKSLLEQGSFYAQPCLYLVRRNYWKACKFSFPAGIHEDEDILIRLFMSAQRVSIADEVLFYRRVRPSSLMTMKKTTAHMRARERNVRYALEDLARVPATDRALRKLLRKRCEMFLDAYMSVAREIGAKSNALLLLRVAFRRKNRALTRRVYHEIFRSFRYS